MKRSRPPKMHLLAFSAALFFASPAASAQGKFTNFETPHTKPITTATVFLESISKEVVLVCNSADNSVEIYDAAAPFKFYQRVPVGLGPTSVRWNAVNSCFYTCNFDGDSVSRVKLDLEPAGTGFVPVGSLLKTTHVGDQPADIGFDGSGVIAAVTLSGRSESVLVNANSLDTIVSSVLTALEPSITNGTAVAPKAPRQVAVLPDGRSFVLNHMGTGPAPGGAAIPRVDVDLWFQDPAAPTGIPGVLGRQIGGLGTTNEGFAINAAGDTMVVVGTRAMNEAPTATGEAGVSALPFGFVESHMWIVDITPSLTGTVPTVIAEAPFGATPTLPLMSRNLNRDYASAVSAAVGFSDAVSQPSDVALIESEGEIDIIAVTMFHSDKVVLYQVNSNVNGGYVETQINLTTLPGYSTSGPSGITYNAVEDLLYVTCRLDSSLHTIDPRTFAVTSRALNNDPTPQYIRDGRKFLYDADFSSGSGFVSCASCHINGTTDGLPWDLGTPGGLAIPGPVDGLVNPFTPAVFPGPKGPMITQTLQGLVNYEVNKDAQYLFSNAPYHWRGDKPGFSDFDVAFKGLLQRPQGVLGFAEMSTFTDFINSIVHPPNSEQPIDRMVAGSIDDSDPDNPFNPLNTGAKLGLQIFHNFPSDGQGPFGVSCASCHTLPDGSDNLLTEAFSFPTPISQPFETAALRNLVPRESHLRRTNDTAGPFAAVSNFGLTHGGIGLGLVEQQAINFFVDSSAFKFPGFGFNAMGQFVPSLQRPQFASALIQYTRELDWCMAPGVGRAYTLDPAKPLDAAIAFTQFEAQVEDANIGLSVIVRTGSTYRGFFYDLTQSPPAYREEGTANFLTSLALTALAAPVGDAVILQGTAPGNERRIASPTGIASTIAGASAPSNLTLEPMAPMSYHVDIPKLTAFTGITPGTAPPVSGRLSSWALKTLQFAVLGNFGIPATPNHQPPRRFRVTGDNIRPGAQLVIGVRDTTMAGARDHILVLDIYPTKYISNGRIVWESEEELGPILTLAMLNGGPWAPGVLGTLLRNVPGSGALLTPLSSNKFPVAVVNEDGTVNSPILGAVLQVQDAR